MFYVETSFLWFLLEENTLKPFIIYILKHDYFQLLFYLFFLPISVIIYILKHDYFQLLMEKDFKIKRFQHGMFPEGLNYHPQNFQSFCSTLLIQIKVILFFVVR